MSQVTISKTEHDALLNKAASFDLLLEKHNELLVVVGKKFAVEANVPEDRVLGDQTPVKVNLEVKTDQKNRSK